DKLEEGILVERTLYYPNGTPKEHVTYNNSIIDGLKKTYLPDGEPATVEEWDNGYQHGLTIIYQHGEKFAEIPYNRGRKDGIERRYRDGKDLFQEVTWVEGLEGPTRNYAPR